ncbi:MAG TPA: TorF family putative porin [Burkholderiales bacterium]|nr:TorF family putative porin [Burkholderiales bacterium]
MAVAGLLASAVAPAVSFAGDPPPEHTFTGNVGLFSQYIFRGLTQTDRDPAIQGGLDYAHSSGIYLGTWASNISWLKENFSAPPNAIAGTYNRGGSMEWDFYGGYKMSFGDVGVDLGTLYYWYPGDINPAVQAVTPGIGVPKADTWEVYGAVSWKWLSAKLSVSVMDHTFGVKDTAGTTYLDLSANVPIGDYYKPLTGLTLNAHWGWQKYRGTDARNGTYFAAAFGGRTPDNDEIFSYKDVKLGLTYALPRDFSVGAFWSKAYDTSVLGYGGIGDAAGGGLFGPFPRAIGKSTGTVFVQKTF